MQYTNVVVTGAQNLNSPPRNIVHTINELLLLLLLRPSSSSSSSPTKKMLCVCEWTYGDGDAMKLMICASDSSASAGPSGWTLARNGRAGTAAALPTPKKRTGNRN
jgi:hypothetical protein